MSITHVMKMLDLNNTAARNLLDLVNLSRIGLPQKSITILENILSVKPKEMARLLSVSVKTIERYKCDHEKKLNPAISERILKIAMVKERCEEVFEDANICAQWVKSENVALGGRTPLDLMESDFGIDMILTELGRIEHGIVS
jgi:putative toxin-antitoxin system antitoxin component (TIGR02293 family)